MPRRIRFCHQCKAKLTDSADKRAYKVRIQIQTYVHHRWQPTGTHLVRWFCVRCMRRLGKDLAFTPRD